MKGWPAALGAMLEVLVLLTVKGSPTRPLGSPLPSFPAPMPPLIPLAERHDPVSTFPLSLSPEVSVSVASRTTPPPLQNSQRPPKAPVHGSPCPGRQDPSVGPRLLSCRIRGVCPQWGSQSCALCSQEGASPYTGTLTGAKNSSETTAQGLPATSPPPLLFL